MMATRHIDAGRASALPLHLLAQAIPMLTRNELASLTERLIECLDEQDGDPDKEDDDPDCAVDDKPCDEDFDREDDRTPWDGQANDPEARHEHCRRIRRTRCITLRERDWQTGQRNGPVLGYELLNEPATPTRRQIMRRKRGMPKRPRA